MNLRSYYQKIRDVETKLEHAVVVLVSRETADGGRAGILTEVPRPLAAKMIVDGRAHQASAEEAETFHEQKREAQAIAEQIDAAKRMHVTVVAPSDLRSPKGSVRTKE